MKSRLCILIVFLSSSIFAQNFWSATSLDNQELKQNKKVTDKEKLYTVDIEAMSNYLAQAPQRQNFAIESNLVVEFPTLNGSFEKFYVAEASNFAPELQTQFPSILSYRGISINNPGVQISFSVSPRGVQTMRLEVGAKTTFIEPISSDNLVYQVFEKNSKDGDWSCHTEEELGASLTERFANNSNPETLDADDRTMRDFRLALSCTGEYAQYFGGTVAGALAGMNATMARVNPIMERDLAVHFTIIANNANVVYTNANTDPYTSTSVPGGIGQWNGQLQSTLSSVIGESNYDIGHLFGATGGGGNAGCIGCVCVNGQKGRGITSPSNGVPEGDTFDIDYVIHEMGHQLGANHTFSASEGTGVNFEPGTGSTIMAYAGLGAQFNVQTNSDDYFHYASIQQITSNVKNKTCPTETTMGNQPPVANAGADYIIPVGTPYILTGSATDPNASDVLSYCWEQVDTSSAGNYIFADPNATTGPLVRSLQPTTSPVRFVPSFDKVLEGDLFSSFESLSNVTRQINYALQVRDNADQTDSDRMRVITRVNGGPFAVTSPTLNSSIASGNQMNLTWDVGQTNQTPINTSMVDIYLSTDGGDNFTLIEENIPNTGSYNLTIPANSSSEEGAYIMVRAVGNIYYSLSPKFYIDYTVSTECEDYSANGLPLNIPDGQAGGTGYGEYAVAAFSVPDLGDVGEISVNVNISHSYVGDLQVLLQAPSPTDAILLWDRQCDGSANINATFTDNGAAVNCGSINGNILPSTSLSTFNGYSTQGNWLIGVRDGYAADTGTFNAATATICSSVVTPLGTSDIRNDKTQISVYPNPSNGLFNISMDLENKGINMTVLDMTGKLLYKHKDANANGSFNYELNISNFEKGVYILQVQNGTTITSKKLIVK